MKILFCAEGYSEARRRLAALLPDDAIVSCAPDDVVAALTGVDKAVQAEGRIDGVGLH